MLQIPLAFKGPAKQIESLFSEEMVYQALQLILADNLIHWQHDELLETVNGVIEDKGYLHKLSINWPIDTDISLGTCPCKNPKPCVHLCAMVIDSKARIDQLPPFTGQLQANRNIQQTLATWINQQTHDPYPNMARHRLVYFLDTDEKEKIFTISLHKAYLSKEERYATKAQVNSSLLQQKPLPKFVSLTDKVILNRLQRNNIIKQHSFQLVNKRDDALLKNILQTGRCFWKNCYRPALQFDTSTQITNKMVKILDSVYILIYQNLVVFKSKQSTPKTTVKVNPSQTITPKLLIQTDEISIPLAYEKIMSLDIGKISFIQGQIEFSFEDLSTGKLLQIVN